MIDKKIHFSVDDTLGCLKWLTKNQESVNSIFDSYVFGFAKYLYEKYGIPTSFYCMYTDGDFALNEVPDIWKKEFRENSHWLKLGFHTYEGNVQYADAEETKIMHDFRVVTEELKRITGGEQNITNVLRLHYFAGNEATVKCLTEQGVLTFLCADDERGSYNLSEDEEKILKRDEFYHSDKYLCDYIPTNIRIENINDMDGEIQKVRCMNGNWITIFTHERYIGLASMRKTIEELFDRLLME